MAEQETIPQVEKSAEETEKPVDIFIGPRKNAGWEQMVRDQRFDPDEGYTDLERDGWHWHPFPKNGDGRRDVEEEREAWIH